MELLIGTRQGLFVSSGAGALRAAAGLQARGVHALLQVNGHVVAVAEDGVYCSEDGGHSWAPSGCAAKDVWTTAAAPSDARVLYAGDTSGAYCGGATTAAARGPRSNRWRESRAGARGLPSDPTGVTRAGRGAGPGRASPPVGRRRGRRDSPDGGWRRYLGRYGGGGQPGHSWGGARPWQPDVFYATTGFGRLGAGGLPETECRAGVYRSDDRGNTWQYVWGDLERRYTRPICIDARAPHALTVGCAPSFRSSWRDEGGAGSRSTRASTAGVAGARWATRRTRPARPT